jgi:nicotinamide phosphoribosyltransferase
MTVENTDPQFYWLTNYLETLLVQTWYPTTVCTQSRAMKHIILDHLIKTGTPESIDFKLHDFGFRGSTSLESSAIGGASHLVNFKGTDTMSALMLLADYYDEPCAGFSIPAAEHSTITSWGKTREADAYKNMLDQFPGMVAVVSDSYDLWNAARNIWGDQLRQNVYTHEGQLIIRPDSGHPPTVVVKLLETLGSVFSVRTNQKGYKVLDDKIRIIQGDGIDLQMLTDILTALSASGWSGHNVAYGSGGGLLQKVNRDTCKFAFKCCAIETAQRGWEPVYKSPVDDPSKASRGGKLTSPDMRIVFENGKLLVDDNLTTIRERAKL